MPSFGGLISGVMGRTAEGYSKAADMEMRKQGELDLKKQLMEVESEKRLREDEIKRGRDVSDRITEETRVRSPEYIAAQAKADADKFDALIKAGVPEAEARATVAKGVAAAGVEKTLAPVKAEVAKVTYDANKPLKMTEAADAIIAKIKETKDLSDDPSYLTSVEKIAMATKKPEVVMNQVRSDALRDRASGGGAGGKLTVKKTFTGEDGSMMAIMSDGTPRDLGIKSADYNKAIAKQIDTMSKNDYKFAKLPEAEKRKQAEARIRGQLDVGPSTSRKDLTKYDLPD
tara:strand:- start:8 stop:868 length:861 start_codon:yes stop_codon:yes gene_type:complete